MENLTLFIIVIMLATIKISDIVVPLIGKGKIIDRREAIVLVIYFVGLCFSIGLILWTVNLYLNLVIGG